MLVMTTLPALQYRALNSLASFGVNVNAGPNYDYTASESIRQRLVDLPLENLAGLASIHR